MRYIRPKRKWYGRMTMGGLKSNPQEGFRPTSSLLQAPFAEGPKFYKGLPTEFSTRRVDSNDPPTYMGLNRKNLAAVVTAASLRASKISLAQLTPLELSKVDPEAYAKSLQEKYNARNLHDMIASVRFMALGRFRVSTSGDFSYEKDLFTVCDDLHLRGFIRVRARYCLGHLQGDPYSLSYLQKYLRNDMSENGRVSSVHFYDDCYGLPEYTFPTLSSVKDWRKESKKRLHHRQAGIAQKMEMRLLKVQQIAKIDE